MEENDNILANRIVEFNKDDKQISILDQRFYSRNKKYYPSVTYVLSFIPKNKIFIDWLKEKGEDSDIIVDKASKRGKKVHGAIEELVKGKELHWLDEQGNAKYDLDVWGMILRFGEFWAIHQPKLIGTEVHCYSDQFEIGGTIDLILEIFGEIWIVDIKTSNQIVRAYHYQTSAYQQMWNECFDKKATRRAILWLKANTKKLGKGDKIQGKGWQLIESPNSFERDFESFELFHKVFLHEVGVLEPYTNLIPTSIKLN